MVYPIITANRYLTLATCNSNGEVWVAPLAYVFDATERVFYFYSAKDSKHSQHIALNALVAVAIFDSSVPSEVAEGLQFNARVEVVKEENLCHVMTLYFESLFSNIEERKKWERPATCFTGDAPQRFYKVTPLNLFKNINKEMIDYRQEIDLKTL